MTANPDMTAIYATGEPALIGAISAVTSQKRTDKVKVFGWDLTAQAIKGIDEGWVVAVVQQDPFQEGEAAVETILKIKKGEKVKPSIDVPVTIVTKENVDKFRACSSKPARPTQARTLRASRIPLPLHEGWLKRMLSADAPSACRWRTSAKRFGAIQTLDDVNLDLRAGEVLGLVGDNGAGKSTLSKILSGAVVPDAGRIEIDGREVALRLARRRAPRSGRDGLSGPLALRHGRRRRQSLPRPRAAAAHARRAAHSTSAHARRRRARCSAISASASPSTRLKVENLSGGQRQSIAIGRAASFDPLVLIMDEPTAALAVAEVEAVLDLIRTVSARGVSVILITHRLQDLFLVCDRIMVMYEGRNVAERRIGETNIEEIVNLIVGRKFRSVSAGDAARARRGHDRDRRAPHALRDRAAG